jgi:hypothetical protein
LHNNTDVDSSSIDGSNLDEENTFLPLWDYHAYLFNQSRPIIVSRSIIYAYFHLPYFRAYLMLPVRSPL